MVRISEVVIGDDAIPVEKRAEYQHYIEGVGIGTQQVEGAFAAIDLPKNRTESINGQKQKDDHANALVGK